MKKQQLFVFKYVLYTLAAMACLFGSTWAQELSVSASVDRNTLSLNNRLVYELKISGGQYSSIIEPDFSGMFDITSQARSQQFSWINGSMSSFVIKKYTLVPVKTGSFVIPAAQVKTDKKTFKSNTVEVTVTTGNSSTLPSQQSNARPAKKSSLKQARGNVFIEGFLDKTSAYVGEQITYTLKLFRHTQFIENVQFRTPKFDGFWVEDLSSSDQHAIETIQGRRFYTFELEKKALFAIKPGTSTIDAAKAGYDVIGFFGQSRVIESPELKLNILPLPDENKPENFTGLVGDFSLSTSVNTTEVSDGSPISLTIILTGIGNIKSVHDVSIDTPPGLKIYQSDVNDVLSDGQTVKGQRHFEYIVVPKASGSFEIPPISLSFFSPTLQDYQTVQTEPITLTASGVASDPRGSAAGSNISQLATDIRYLAPMIGMSPSKPVYTRIWFIILLLINIGTIVMEIGRGLKEVLFSKSPKAREKEQAFQLASNKLQAVDLTQDVKTNVTLFQNILLEFLSKKLDQSFLGLTQDAMTDVLTAKGVSSTTSAAIESAIEHLSMAAFAPTAQSPSSVKKLQERVAHVMTVLEKELSA